VLRKAGKEHVGQLTDKEAVPRWVLIFDEFADLMLERGSKKEMETLLKRLGAKARAAGIHLILGTQRTEASVVTPLLRSNLPARISLKVISERDSNLILEAPDAASLLGRGDLLWRQGAGLTRLQSPFVKREELERLLRLH
jgi:S-DNA-T family DNA segregation ATPase FtsK/SpoIIIE